MKIFIGNTDLNWYRFLASNEETTEVNFWRPHGRHVGFHAIRPGELFFFRLRKPISKIVGFGTYAHHSILTLLMAWETFGPANGCATLSELVDLIARHRRQ